MINSVIITTVTAGVIAAGAGIYLKRRKPVFTDIYLPEGFTITAHTGCEGTKDNTIDSILKGAAAKADIVEIDLHFTSDGKPVLSHDRPKSDNLPSLKSAFEALAGLDVKMNVDVKATDNIPAVCELAEKHGVKDKIFFTGVEEKFVEAVRSGAPEIPYFLNVKADKKKNTDKEYLSMLIEKVKSCGAIGINLNFKSCSKELVSTFRNEGLLVSVWTANKKSEIIRCINLEPDNITSRYPSLVYSVIDNT